MPTTWNHRVVREKDGSLSFAEVHYNDHGLPIGYNDPFVCGDDLDELKELADRLAHAATLPVVEWEEFTGAHDEDPFFSEDENND